MSKMDILAEQTEFLLQKQKEVQECFESELKSLRDFIEVEQEKAEAKTDVSEDKSEDEVKSFKNVSKMIEDYEKECIEVFDQDVEFLTEQMAAIEQISKMEDEKAAEELTGMLLEDGYEMEETGKFKEDVEEETEAAKEGFIGMVEDVKATLVEAGVKELEMLLQAHKADREEDPEGCESSCGKEEGSSCCPGCDIFDLDKE